MYVILCTNGGTCNFFLSYKRGSIYLFNFVFIKETRGCNFIKQIIIKVQSNIFSAFRGHRDLIVLWYIVCFVMKRNCMCIIVYDNIAFDILEEKI